MLLITVRRLFSLPLMALAIGTRLGPYEIQSSLGAGGRGEVYRATDTKLRRDIALKVLPGRYGSRSGAARALSSRGEGPRPTRPSEHRQHALGGGIGWHSLPDHATGGRTPA